MTTVYLIPPGTLVAISANGTCFAPPRMLRQQLQFSTPPELIDVNAIFTDGKRRVIVARDSVISARFDGLGGRNPFGI